MTNQNALCKIKKYVQIENAVHRNQETPFNNRKTISDTLRFLFGSLAVSRPSPKLAFRGSDSGSLGRQHRKPHDGSLATVSATGFRDGSGCAVSHALFNRIRPEISLLQ